MGYGRRDGGGRFGSSLSWELGKMGLNASTIKKSRVRTLGGGGQVVKW